jgi:alcohol dehydrogenase (NADP+)
LKLGAKHFVSTADEDWNEPLKYNFDMIISTTNNLEEDLLKKYLSTLKIMGHYHSVGLPENPITAQVQDFVPNGSYFGSSHIGNRPEMEAMLALAAKQNIKSWVNTIQVGEEGCKEAVEKLKNGDGVRYRYTLVGFDKVFGVRT